MSKLIIVYASMTGNTEMVAEYIAEGIKAAGHEVELKDSFSAMPSDLLDYDGILLGAYTWDDGEIPDEFLDFYEEMDDVDLTGKKCAAFGSCDSFYEETFGGAVDKIVDKLTECGAEVVLEGLKIELTPEDGEVDRCIEFGLQFIEKLS